MNWFLLLFLMWYLIFGIIACGVIIFVHHCITNREKPTDVISGMENPTDKILRIWKNLIEKPDPPSPAQEKNHAVERKKKRRRRKQSVSWTSLERKRPVSSKSAPTATSVENPSTSPESVQLERSTDTSLATIITETSRSKTSPSEFYTTSGRYIIYLFFLSVIKVIHIYFTYLYIVLQVQTDHQPQQRPKPVHQNPIPLQVIYLFKKKKIQT